MKIFKIILYIYILYSMEIDDNYTVAVELVLRLQPARQEKPLIIL